VREKSTYGVLLSSLFYSYDRDSSGCVDAVELAAGFSLLCAGNKVYQHNIITQYKYADMSQRLCTANAAVHMMM
jgi:hypothetical protein